MAGYCLLAWILLAGTAYADKGYTIRDLGDFGGTGAAVQVITDQSMMLINVAGRNNVTYQFILDGRRVTPLPSGHVGNAMISRGEVVGAGSSGAWLYRNGRLTNLSPNYPSSGANAISDNGIIAGWAAGIDQYTPYARPVIWLNGAIQELGGFPLTHLTERYQAWATGVNESGRVAGYEMVEGWAPWTFYWNSPAALNFVALPGSTGIATQSMYPASVNRRGDVLAYTHQFCDDRKIYVFQNGAPHLIAAPGPSRAIALNDSDTVLARRYVVACGAQENDGGAPFVADERSYSMLPMPPRATSISATTINNYGDVAGSALYPDGWHAVVWDSKQHGHDRHDR